MMIYKINTKYLKTMRTAFNDFFYEKRGSASCDDIATLAFPDCGYFDRHVQQHTVHLSDFVSENAVLDLHVLHRRFHIGVFPVKR